jgi:hypothetical protein
MIVYFNNDEVQEVFDVQLRDDILILGTFVGWKMYQSQGHILIDSDGFTMEFDVNKISEMGLENGGTEITYGIAW